MDWVQNSNSTLVIKLKQWFDLSLSIHSMPYGPFKRLGQYILKNKKSSSLPLVGVVDNDPHDYDLMKWKNKFPNE